MRDLDGFRSMVQHALVEVIGEAANRVSEDTRRAHPEIPWADIAGSRHRLIHGYDSVDFDILWHIVSDDLRTLIPQLEGVLDERG
ncbi:MAG: DUF86 domain-containing protein [Fimbriimonadaceae bacterium]|nr:DUF86 domain-containing protein [Fimbriimonadaceae bacterium]